MKNDKSENQKDNGRLTFLNTCGLDNLIDLCIYCGKLEFSISDPQKSVEKDTLVSVSLGCLHNVTNENGLNFFFEKLLNKS